jgi:hypothetical protein
LETGPHCLFILEILEERKKESRGGNTQEVRGRVWKTPQFPALAVSSWTFAGFVKGFLRRGTHRSGRVLEDAGT